MDDVEPRTAATFMQGLVSATVPAAPTDAAGPWPPHGWCSNPGVKCARGVEFDWTPPPAGFGPDQAREWVDRAIRMHRYNLEVIGLSASNVNGPRESALGNANLMVENLIGRRAAPAAPRRLLYRGPMDELDKAEELGQLELVRDWLDGVVARVERAARVSSREQQARATRRLNPRLKTEWRLGFVYLNGEKLTESKEVCLYLEAMILLGDWASREDIGDKMRQIATAANELRGKVFSRLDRLQKRIASGSVAAVIESVSGTGTRVKPEYLE